MSQGQATRSTLTRSRVIHFMVRFSFRERYIAVIEVSLRMEWEVNVLAQDQLACHRCSPSFSLDRHHVDDKGYQGEQHPRLLKAYGIYGTAKGRVKADKEIRHQGAQHVIGTHWWNGIVVQCPGIPC